MDNPGSAGNTAPVALADAVATTVGTPVVFDPRGNDTDADGDILTITAVGSALRGTVVNNGVSITYIPNAGYVGPDAFTYTVSDGRGGATTQTVSVTVTGDTRSNRAPILGTDTLKTGVGKPITFDPRVNDADPEGDLFRTVAVGGAAHGSAVINADGSITYTPTAGYSGPDSFTYTVNDPKGGVAVGTVNVTVTLNGAPRPTADAISTLMNASVTLDPRVNDTDPNYDLLTITAVGAAAHGSAAIVGGGTGVLYTPAAGYTGPDSFTYSVSDPAGEVVTSTVTVMVLAPQVGNGFYAPTIASVEAGTTGATVGGTTFDITSQTGKAILFSPPPSATFTYEINVTSAAAGAAMLGVATPGWFNAGGDAGTTAAAAAGWRVGGRTDFGGPTGTSATWASSQVWYDPPAYQTNIYDWRPDGTYGPVGTRWYDPPGYWQTVYAADTTPSTNDVLGFTYSATTRKLRIYRNGALVATETLPANTPEGQLAPAILGFAGRMAGSIRTTASSYAASYAYDTAATNTTPTAANDSIGTFTGKAVVFDPRANDVDNDGDRLTITAVGAAAHGAVTINNGVSLTYTPAAGYAGADSFTYTVTDAQGHAVTATVMVSVAAQSAIGFYQPFIRVAEAGMTGATVGATTFDIPQASNKALLGSAPPSQNFTYEISVTSLGWAAGMLGVATQAWYDAGGDYNTTARGMGGWYIGNTHSFGDASGTTAQWETEWWDDGDGPYQRPLAYRTLSPGDTLGVTYSASTRKARFYVNGQLYMTLTLSPEIGAAQAYPSITSWGGRVAGSFRATPSSYSGSYIIDAQAVQTAPVAANDSQTVLQGSTLIFDPRANDLDADGDPLAITAVSSAAHGTVSYSAGSVIYTPAAGYVGPDSFTYTISDGRGGTTTGTVSVTVAAPNANRAPTARPDSVSTLQHRAVTFDPRGNDTDPDLDALVITGVGAAANGTVTINNGVSLTYQPTGHFFGSDAFTYTVSDGRGGSVTNTVTVTVNQGANQAPVATSDVVVTWQGKPLTFDPRINDIEPDGDSLTLTAVGAPVHGTTAIAGGLIVYTPTSGYAGPDAFTYTVSDGRGGTVTASVSVTVLAEQAPSAANDTVQVYKNQPLVFDPRVNDSDPEGDPLTIVAVGMAGHGTLSILAGGTGLRYAPATSYAGADSFTYTVSDGRGGLTTATVNLTVADAPADPSGNRAPVAIDDRLTTYVGQPLAFDPRLNDSDADDNRLKVTAVGAPAHGTLTIVNGATLLYTPTPGYVGSDSFTYTVADGRGGSMNGLAQVAVVASPTNRLPVAKDDAVVADGGPLTLDPRVNDRDPDGAPLLITGVGTAQHGIVSILNGGTAIRYVPDTGYVGPDTFTYTVSDGQGGEVTGVVTVTGPRALNFYQPKFAGQEAGITGLSVDGVTFDIPAANDATLRMTAPPTASFSYEIDVTQMGVNSGWVGVANQAWWNEASGGVSLGSNASKGGAYWLAGSGLFTGGGGADFLNATRVPQPGDVLGVVYSATARTTRIYLNGELIGRIYDSDAGDPTGRFPVMVSNAARMAGAFRATASSYAQRYVMDEGVTQVTAQTGKTLTFDPRLTPVDSQGAALPITAVGAAAHGTVTIVNGGGGVSYTPAAGYIGLDTFTFTTTNAQGVDADPDAQGHAAAELLPAEVPHRRRRLQHLQQRHDLRPAGQCLLAGDRRRPAPDQELHLRDQRHRGRCGLGLRGGREPGLG
jgi:hypothetical protein